jgi:hypothetical protein
MAGVLIGEGPNLAQDETGLRPELERINDFSAVLGRLVDIRVTPVEFDFTDNQPVEIAAQRLLFYERKAVPSLYLHPTVDLAGTPTLEPPSFTPRKTRSGKRSGHGVFFGDLEFSDGQQLSVAVKPHTVDSETSCLTDYLSNCAVNELGFFGLQPVGFIMEAGQKTAYSLTYLEETLTTLDSIDWTRFYPNIHGNPGMQEIWLRTARQLALLHSNGSMNHGDFAPRNIATTAVGDLFFIDWEKAQVNMMQPRDAEIRFGLSQTDLLTLLESFCRPRSDNYKAGIGLFSGKEGDWWQSFCDFFYDEYVAFRHELAAVGSHHTSKQAEVEEELVELNRSLQNSMDLFRDLAAA